MSDLHKAAEMALEDICGAKLCEINSMSSRAEMLRLMDKAAQALRQALAQPDWVGLTESEIDGLIASATYMDETSLLDVVDLVQAKLKEKNGG